VAGAIPTAVVYMPTYELSRALLADTPFLPFAAVIAVRSGVVRSFTPRDAGSHGNTLCVRACPNLCTEGAAAAESPQRVITRPHMCAALAPFKSTLWSTASPALSAQF
jgi:hypothetical protein